MAVILVGDARANLLIVTAPVMDYRQQSCTNTLWVGRQPNRAAPTTNETFYYSHSAGGRTALEFTSRTSTQPRSFRRLCVPLPTRRGGRTRRAPDCPGRGPQIAAVRAKLRLGGARPAVHRRRHHRHARVDGFRHEFPGVELVGSEPPLYSRIASGSGPIIVFFGFPWSHVPDVGITFRSLQLEGLH